MQKIVWVMELKEDKVQDYIEVHKKENVWPEIIAVNPLIRTPPEPEPE